LHVHDPGVDDPLARVITLDKEVLGGLDKASLVLFIGLGSSDSSLRLRSYGLGHWGLSNWGLSCDGFRSEGGVSGRGSGGNRWDFSRWGHSGRRSERDRVGD
jgi:hypothetical protein